MSLERDPEYNCLYTRNYMYIILLTILIGLVANLQVKFRQLYSPALPLHKNPTNHKQLHKWHHYYSDTISIEMPSSGSAKGGREGGKMTHTELGLYHIPRVVQHYSAMT